MAGPSMSIMSGFGNETLRQVRELTCGPPVNCDSAKDETGIAVGTAVRLISTNNLLSCDESIICNYGN